MPGSGNKAHAIAGTWLVFGVFLVFALTFTLLKGNFATHYRSWVDTGPETGAGIHLACTQIHTCMRLAGPLFEQSLTALFRAAAGLLFMDPSASALQSPWGMATPTAAERFAAARSAGFTVARVIFLLPILWFTMVGIRATVPRLLFLGVLFMAMAGWPPPVLDMFFSAARAVTSADWPESYFNFAQRAAIWDFGSIGFIFLLTLYIARRRHKRPWEMAGLTVLGQLVFENNGVVTGIALFSATLLMPLQVHETRRIRLALRRLGICAMTSAGLATAFLVLFLATNQETPGAAGGFTGAIADYVVSYWRNYGHYNFDWFNVIVANMISLVAIPVLFGSAVGGVSALINRDATEDYRRRAWADAWAGLSTAIGFMATVVIGFFISGLASEMGRQLLPLLGMACVFAAKGTEALVFRFTTPGR